ncbi:MAG: ABC transporter permease subunit [Lachnospiraceae bacterium]|nr:ABC transporter permease subunit [Lachnospiraceae bacterium]
MKNNIWTIMKKELARFFGDKRLVFTTILLPGLMIYIIYSLMGDGMANLYGPKADYVGKGYAINCTEPEKALLAGVPLEIEDIDIAQKDEVIEEIKSKDKDFLIIFPDGFIRAVEEYDITTGEEAPGVELYYNSTNTDSSAVVQGIMDSLNNYEDSIANKFDINKGKEAYDCASKEDMAGMTLAMILPFLLLTFLYSGCIAVTPESIAGEKERGTIATLLVTPLKRSHLALGKIFSLCIITFLAAVSSFLGTVLSMPKLMGAGTDGVSMDIYKPLDFVLVFVIIVTTVLVMVGVLSIISAFSKSVKEAGTASGPLVVVIMLVGMSSMFDSVSAKLPWHYMIPLYNSANCFKQIFSFDYSMTNVLICIVSNIVVSGILTLVLTKLFDSEKVMFAK